MKYCIDTSSLIDLKDLYPRDIFKTIWEDFEELITNNEVVSTYTVYKEIKAGFDELSPWSEQFKSMFLTPTQFEENIIKKITKNYPKLVNPNKTRPDADPYVIALAKSYDLTLITEEDNGTEQHPRIPYVCKELDVKCIKLLSFFRELNWQF